MDTPIIAQYYRETEPEKRKELHEQAIASGEIRKQIRSVKKSGKHVTKERPNEGGMPTVI